MLLIFFFLLTGMFTGYFSKKDSHLHLYSEKVSMLCVYLLLVFMGISTAQNENFLEIFTDSGKISLFLSFFGMLGSIAFTLPVYKFFKSHKSLLWSFLQFKNNRAYENNDTDTQKKTVKLELISNNDIPSVKKKSDIMLILIPLICYFIGVTISFVLPRYNFIDDLVMYSLYGLLFFTGIGIGTLNIFELLRRYHILIILIPFLALLGSLAGGLTVNYLFGLSRARECLSINAGMGYYSISAIINKSFLGDKIGLIALLTNLIREAVTMLFCPFLVRVFGPLAPISTGGATSMDTSLPFIRKNTCPEYALIAFFNGVILTVVVPPLTSFIAGF